MTWLHSYTGSTYGNTRKAHTNHLVMGIHMCDTTYVTLSHVWQDSFIHRKHMRQQHRLFYKALLQKRPIISHAAIEAKHTPSILLWEYIWMCYVTHMNESCHTHICMCLTQKAHTTTRMKHIGDMTHPHVWQDSLMCVPWLVDRQEDHTARKATHTRHSLLWQYIRVTWLILMFHITPSFLCFISLLHTARQASSCFVFHALYPLLFDLYHSLGTNVFNNLYY